MHDLFFPVCAKITLIRQQRTRTNIAPTPPYSMLTLGGGSPTNGNERLFHNGTTPPMRANIELVVEGGAVACVSGVWMSVIFTHTGPLTINNMVATWEGRGEMDGRMEGGREGRMEGERVR